MSGKAYFCVTSPLGGGFKHETYPKLGKCFNLTCAYFSDGLVSSTTSGQSFKVGGCGFDVVRIYIIRSSEDASEIRRSPVDVVNIILFTGSTTHPRWWSPDFWSVNNSIHTMVHLKLDMCWGFLVLHYTTANTQHLQQVLDWWETLAKKERWLANLRPLQGYLVKELMGSISR